VGEVPSGRRHQPADPHRAEGRLSAYGSGTPRGEGGQHSSGARAYLDPSSPYKPTFEHDALAAQARRVLEIPQPKAAAAKKPVGKLTVGKTTVPVKKKGGGGSGGSAGATAAAKPTAVAHAGPRASVSTLPKPTSGDVYTLAELGLQASDLEGAYSADKIAQKKSTLRKVVYVFGRAYACISGGAGSAELHPLVPRAIWDGRVLSYPGRSGKYEGIRVWHRRDEYVMDRDAERIRVASSAPEPAPKGVAAMYGKTLSAEQLKLRPEQIEKSLDEGDLHGVGADRPDGGYVGEVLMIADQWFAITGCRNHGTGDEPRSTYTLRRVLAQATPRPFGTISWAKRRDQYPKLPPEDVPLQGVLAEDPFGKVWVIGPEEQWIECEVPRVQKAPAAAEASASTPAIGEDVVRIPVPGIPEKTGHIHILLQRHNNGWNAGHIADLSGANLGSRTTPPEAANVTCPADWTAVLLELESLRASGAQGAKQLEPKKQAAAKTVVAALAKAIKELEAAQDLRAFPGEVSTARRCSRQQARSGHPPPTYRHQDTIQVPGIPPGVGDLTLYHEKGKDGRIRTGHKLYFKRGSLGSSRELPALDGPSYSRPQDASHAELDRVIKIVDAMRGKPYTPADESAAREMGKALREAQELLAEERAKAAPGSLLAAESTAVPQPPPADKREDGIPGTRDQTLGQWMATVRGCLPKELRGRLAAGPSSVLAAKYFENGWRPGAAAKAIKKLWQGECAAAGHGLGVGVDRPNGKASPADPAAIALDNAAAGYQPAAH
jgi:hypothetical protein